MRFTTQLTQWGHVERGQFTKLPFYWAVLCTFFRQKLTVGNCPTWISGKERMTSENISWSISTKECCRPGRVYPATSWSPVGRASDETEPRRYLRLERINTFKNHLKSSYLNLLPVYENYSCFRRQVIQNVGIRRKSHNHETQPSAKAPRRHHAPTKIERTKGTITETQDTTITLHAFSFTKGADQGFCEANNKSSSNPWKIALDQSMTFDKVLPEEWQTLSLSTPMCVNNEARPTPKQTM